MTDNLNPRCTRRSWLAAAAAGAAWAGHGATAQAASNDTAAVKTYTNADFYDSEGKLLKDKAREAYYDMFRRFHYPISERLKRDMWILDFGLGDFAHVRHGRHFLAQPPGPQLFRPRDLSASRPDDRRTLPRGHRQRRAEDGIVASPPRQHLHLRRRRAHAGPDRKNSGQPARRRQLATLPAARDRRAGAPQPADGLALHGRRPTGRPSSPSTARSTTWTA